jgi:hypothetical protein
VVPAIRSHFLFKERSARIFICSRYPELQFVSGKGFYKYGSIQALDFSTCSRHRSVRHTLTANFTITAGASISVNEQIQRSGITKNNFEKDLLYTVTSSDRHTKQDWTVQAYNNDYSLSWGLGHFINSYADNEKSYNWYIDQSTSGNFAAVNCDRLLLMAIKWADPDFKNGS